jgi:hypothetical protein
MLTVWPPCSLGMWAGRAASTLSLRHGARRSMVPFTSTRRRRAERLHGAAARPGFRLLLDPPPPLPPSLPATLTSPLARASYFLFSPLQTQLRRRSTLHGRTTAATCSASPLASRGAAHRRPRLHWPPGLRTQWGRRPHCCRAHVDRRFIIAAAIGTQENKHRLKLLTRKEVRHYHPQLSVKSVCYRDQLKLILFWCFKFNQELKIIEHCKVHTNSLNWNQEVVQ